MGLDDINVLEKFFKKCSTMSTIFNTVTFFKYWLQAHLQRIQSISNIFRVFRCFKIDFPNPKPNNPHNKYEQFWVHFFICHKCWMLLVKLKYHLLYYYFMLNISIFYVHCTLNYSISICVKSELHFLNFVSNVKRQVNQSG